MKKLLKSFIVFILIVEAHRALRVFKPKIILVSGSVGKTTTKDIIFHLLKKDNEVRKSSKSFNSEIGVPLTILGLPNSWTSVIGWANNLWRGFCVVYKEKNYPKVLILEIGSDHPGDISSLLRWMKPDISVVTLLPDMPVHVENFASPEEIRHEDGLVVGALQSGGVFISNADDSNQGLLIDYAKSKSIAIIDFGFKKSASIHSLKPKIRYAVNNGVERPAGMHFEVKYKNEKYPVYVNGVLGHQVCSAVLAALACGVAHGRSMMHMADDMILFESPPGRMRIIEGLLGSTIIDDSYNSSPIALKAALETLDDVKGERKIAILGDMLELGEYSEDEHRTAGKIARDVVNELVTVGKNSRFIAEAAISSGLSESNVHQYLNAVEAGNYVKSILKKGDVILIKGSQGSGESMIRLERAVKVLMSDVSVADTKLVRQEEEWQRHYEADSRQTS